MKEAGPEGEGGRYS